MNKETVSNELRIELHKINVNFTNSWDFILKRDNPFQFLYNKHPYINQDERLRIDEAIARANKKVLNPTHHQPQLSLPRSAPAAVGQRDGQYSDETPKKTSWWPFNDGKNARENLES